MNLAPQIEKRRAYRALDQRTIPVDVLERLVRAGHTAPSCMNSQPWRFITVTDPNQLAALKATLTTGNYWGQPAPAITAVVTHLEWDAKLDQGREYALFDTGMAALAYQLQAVQEGLTVHPIAGFDAAQAAQVLGLPAGAILVTLLILGYPGSPEGLNDRHREAETAPRNRKPLAEVFAWNTWNAGLLPPSKN